jgi:hypothetical protein
MYGRRRGTGYSRSNAADQEIAAIKIHFRRHGGPSVRLREFSENVCRQNLN